MKYEDIYIKDYEMVEQLVGGLRDYFHFYNTERSHQGLGGSSPGEVYGSSSLFKRVA